MAQEEHFKNFTYTKPWAELEEIDYIYVKRLASTANRKFNR